MAGLTGHAVDREAGRQAVNLAAVVRPDLFERVEAVGRKVVGHFFGRENMRLELLTGVVGMGLIASTSFAALDPSDPSIINLYRFNEATSGDLVNSPFPNQFLDTAPTGTPQNHDDLNAGNPTW